MHRAIQRKRLGSTMRIGTQQMECSQPEGLFLDMKKQKASDLQTPNREKPTTNRKKSSPSKSSRNSKKNVNPSPQGALTAGTRE